MNVSLSIGFQRMRFQVYRHLAAVLAGTAVTVSIAHAGPIHQGYLQYREWQSYDWPDPEVSSPTSVSRIAHEAGWARHDGNTTIAVDYDYQPLRIRSGSPAHNGHLHRLSTGMTHDGKRFRVQGQLGVQGTSNIFKYRDFPDEVLNARLAVFHSVTGEGAPMIGVGGDHRFGSFRWIPRFYWRGRSELGSLELDLPVLAQWHSPERQWRLRIERAGDRWAALDSERERESRIFLREWRLEGWYRLPLQRPVPDPALVLGLSIDTRVEYLDEELGKLDLRLGDAIFAGLRLNW